MPSSCAAQLKRTDTQEERRQTGSKMPKKSHVWNHFTRLTESHGSNARKAKCNSCSKEFDTTGGTTNMWKHYKKFHQQAHANVQTAALPLPPASAASGSGPSSTDRVPASCLGEDEASGDLARMIALGGYDPSVVEDDYFKSFIRRLNPGYEVPSRRAVEEMCDAICDEAKEDFHSRLRDTDARLSFSLGTAKTIEADQVMYVACHFIDNQWNLHRMVTDAYVVVPHLDYYGPLLGAREVESTDYLGDDFFAGLLEKMGDFMAINKTSELGPFMTACGIPSIGDYRREGIVGYFTRTYTDNEFHSIAESFSPHLDFGNIYDNVRSLHLTRQKREKLLSDSGLEHVWAHDKGWYSRYCSLQVLHDEASSTSVETDSEIRQVTLKIWGEIYRAIQSISASRSPTSNLYLIELFKVREVLYSEEAEQVTDLADCLTRAKCTLNSAIQESYLLWSIPLVLDPRYKLKYIEFIFRKILKSNAANVVSKVAQNIEELYGRYVKEYSGDGRNEMNVDNSDNLSWEDMREAETELARYLKDSCARSNEAFDILNWWKVHSSDYPMVARMARDALAMPTCSKLSLEQTARVRSIVRGYSKKPLEKHLPPVKKLTKVSKRKNKHRRNLSPSASVTIKKRKMSNKVQFVQQRSSLHFKKKKKEAHGKRKCKKATWGGCQVVQLSS